MTRTFEYFEPEALLLSSMLKTARNFSPGCAMSVVNVPESRQFNFYQDAYNHVCMALQDFYGEFEQDSTLDGLIIRRVK